MSNPAPGVRVIDLSNTIKDIEADYMKESLFCDIDVKIEDVAEGFLVAHEQLGVGYVVRSELLQMKCDVKTQTLVAFIGYSPICLCKNEALRPVRINPVRWQALLEESGIRK